MPVVEELERAFQVGYMASIRFYYNTQTQYCNFSAFKLLPIIAKTLNFDMNLGT